MTSPEPEKSWTGDIYREGLLAIAQREGVSLVQAAEIARQDAIAGHGEEHIGPINQALQDLLSSGVGRSPKP